MNAVKIKDKLLKVPIIQGGMGVGISRCNLAGAVAFEGAMGVISTAQIGYDDDDFFNHPEQTNLRVLSSQIQRAINLSKGNGLIAINAMVATNHYEAYIKTACKAGVDAIISGAGLPTDLPEYTKDYDVLLAPIVSSQKSARVILKYWDKKFNRTADFLVIEGPQAGGHLGFSNEELEHMDSLDYDSEIKKIIELKKTYEEKFKTSIPVFVGGGIFTKEDVSHVLALGADGVQVATRFVVTKECDASLTYKQAYLDATNEDVVIIKSPVGMPGRAINNAFVKKVSKSKETITHCFNCLKACKPKEAPYCITQALINAVKGNLEQGLIFCGARVGELKKMTTVKEVIEELS